MINASQLPQSFRIDCEIADLELQAADAPAEGQPIKARDFSMTAYTGGPMRVGGFGLPVVVDLAGMSVPTQRRPIFHTHDRAAIVGHSEKITVTAQTVKVGGRISGIGQQAQEVVATADNGFPWQSSIGCDELQMEFVDRGASVKVNGRVQNGPVYVARRSRLREISFAALGADDTSSAAISATSPTPSPSFQETPLMTFEQFLAANGFEQATLSTSQLAILQASYDATNETPEDDDPEINASELVNDIRSQATAEISRVRKISQICASYKNPTVTVKVDGKDQSLDLEAHAIDANLSIEQTELLALRASRPASPGIHISRGAAPTPQILEAAVAIAGKLPNVETTFNEQTLEAAHRQYRRGISLQELILEAAYMNGYSGRSNFRGHMRDILEAAFSTNEISGILSNTANKFLLSGFENVENAWRAIASTKPVNDFKTVTGYRLTGDMMFEQVGNDGELKHGKLGEDSYTNKADTFGKILSITRQDMINDDMGALTLVPRRLGRGASLKLNDVFWKTFLDNATFFAAGNNNYFAGGTSNLQSSSLQTAEQKFLEQVDQDDNVMALTPSLLLVPPSLNVTARELYVSNAINTGGSSTKDKVPSTNIWSGRFQPVVSSYLSNAKYTGNSTTGWYLLADPMEESTIEVVFLNGQESPIVESADADFNQLGIQMRGYFDFGVAKREHRAGVKSKGAA